MAGGMDTSGCFGNVARGLGWMLKEMESDAPKALEWLFNEPEAFEQVTVPGHSRRAWSL